MLPKQYAWLANEGAPAMLMQALALYGIIEGPGKSNNPIIMGWAKECGIKGYTHDEIAWCGLAMAVCAKRAGWDYNPAGNALGARNWLEWGQAVDTPMLGDVLVFWRERRTGWKGHVGEYAGEDATHYHVIGGNQGNAFNIKRIGKDRLLGARRPKWKRAQPKNIRRVFLAATGAPSTNEA